MDFRFKVIGLSDERDSNFVIGKIYEAKHGTVIGEDGFEFTSWARLGSTFANLQEWFAKWYIFEFVDEIIPDLADKTCTIKNSGDDPVNHPSHYTSGKIEVADFIADQKLNFDRGNAVKYVCRAGKKDPTKEIQDLEKAIWYIQHEIKTLKGDVEDGEKDA